MFDQASSADEYRALARSRAHKFKGPILLQSMEFDL